MKYFLTLVAFLVIGLVAQAQSKEEENKLVNFNFQLKNMHYWRGYAVSTAPLMASSLYYQSPNEQWSMGFWGAMGFSGQYREFDYFVAFRKGGFSASLWDIYNFSSPEITGNGFFDYNNRTTGRFIDLTLAYQFGEKFPLKLSASTILHGRDSRFVLREADPFFERTGDLRYTSYVEVRYPILKNKSHELQAFVGGAIALAGAGETFYTTRNAINFIGLQYQKVLEIGNYKIPVQATPAWNPNAKHAYMEIAISFF